MKKISIKILAFVLGLLTVNQTKAQSVIFSEDWSSGTFTANAWTFPLGQGNWTVGASYTPTGGTSPNAFFSYSPVLSNYTISLLSNTISAVANPVGPITLDYLLQLNNFSTSSVEQFIVEYKSVGASTWSTVAIYTNSVVSILNWAVNNFTLVGMQGQVFQLRFTAFGANSNSLNGWGLDNIVVKAPCLPNLAVSVSPNACAAGNRTLTATGSSNYTWTPGGSTGSSLVVNPSSNTIYTVASTNTVGGCVDSRTVFVGFNPTVTATGPGTVCGSSSVSIGASGATSYTWNTGQTGASIAVNPTITTTYSVTGSIGQGCSSTATVMVSVVGPTLIATGYSVCASSASANLIANASAGSNINWYATNTPTGAIASGSAYATPIVTANTIYYAQASGTNTALNSIFTTTAAGNSSPGNMFDVVPNNNITLSAVDMSIISPGTVTVEIWYRSGSFVGFESSNAGWTSVYSGTVNSPGTGTLVNVSGFSLPLSAGQTYGLYITTNTSGVNVNYTNGTALGNVYVSNSDIIVKEGKGGGYFSVINSPRIFNGKLYYNAGGCTSPMVPVSVILNYCVGIKDVSKDVLNVNVYPNPNNGEFTVELANGSSKLIEVIDISGRVVKQVKSNDDSVNMNLNGFASGLYYLKITSNNITDVTKIMKQ
ncbi:MAG: T9SS type A sorting domain-containing protein [Bacteroidia bacterium]